MDEKQKYTCSDCKFFKQHYVKSINRFTKTVAGHCLLKVSTPNGGIRYTHTKSCNEWEEQEPQDDQVKENVKSLLLYMAQRIEEIAEVLNNEE